MTACAATPAFHATRRSDVEHDARPPRCSVRVIPALQLDIRRVRRVSAAIAERAALASRARSRLPQCPPKRYFAARCVQAKRRHPPRRRAVHVYPGVRLRDLLSPWPNGGSRRALHPARRRASLPGEPLGDPDCAIVARPAGSPASAAIGPAWRCLLFGHSTVPSDRGLALPRKPDMLGIALAADRRAAMLAQRARRRIHRRVGASRAAPGLEAWRSSAGRARCAPQGRSHLNCASGGAAVRRALTAVGDVRLRRRGRRGAA